MHIDYDTFAGLSPLQKNKAVHGMSAENFSHIVTTHWQRFLATNTSRLTIEQIGFVQDCIDSVRPHTHQETPSNGEGSAERREDMRGRARELFVIEDWMKLDIEVFKNSGIIRNPIAQALVRAKPHIEESAVENLLAALYDLATLPMSELRSRRYGDYDLATLIGRAFVGMPASEKFWTLLPDEDVTLAAWRSYRVLNANRKSNPDVN